MNLENRNILLFGAYYLNKGASLLIETVRFIHPKDVLTIPVGLSFKTYKENKRRGIHSVFYLRFGPFNFFDIFHFFPKNFLARRKISRLKDIKYMYDISGFAYGDHWSKNILKYAYSLYSYSPKKLIILPQAFGKFQDRDDLTIKYFNSADKIYARDLVSLKNITALKLKKHPILKPDITFSLQVESANKTIDLLIIPNFKLIERSIYKIDEWCEQLLEILRNNPENQNVKFLIHEGEKDEMMAKYFNRITESNIEILKGETGMDCKKIISNSKIVISGRYHGVISALSTGASTYSYSWSHKYYEIMKEFNLEENIIKAEDKNIKLNFDNKPQEEIRLEFNRVIREEIEWFQ